MNRLCNGIDQHLTTLLNALLAFLVMDVTWQVITRFLLADPSSITEELARFLLIWIGLVGAAQAYRHKMHLGIDLLAQKLNPVQGIWLNRFIHACCLLFAISILIIGGCNLMWLTWTLEQFSPAMHLPMALVYAALPLSGVLICLYAVQFIIDPTAAGVTE
ncbi:TRAP transporter small permease [Simiduia agarivorans]|uniref:TRAP transporter small permease protein n=1 Tax=Simiduia agarivorans (strain DSM 21679 / JCM 13881 / BCRC 17597 / SA1) TaxID=1117647 RepID=K4KIG4_SIMAS|nr:TRAP transporter small permease [Simiduia agarivorans]AFU98816.1 aspartate kinase [Simiduia agarivorans SA1 = DSM 21679]